MEKIEPVVNVVLVEGDRLFQVLKELQGNAGLSRFGRGGSLCFGDSLSLVSLEDCSRALLIKAELMAS